MKGQYFKTTDRDYYGYRYNFLGEKIDLTIPVIDFVSILYYAIAQKCSRHAHKAYFKKNIISKIYLKVLSPIEFKLRKIEKK
jgi:hypothetical protein